MGKITIQEPKTDEKVYQKWFLYYQDQFDANNGIVNAPENEKPDIARQAYTDALKEWEKKVEHKQHQNTAGVTFLTLGLIVVSIVLVIGAMDPSKSMKFGN